MCKQWCPAVILLSWELRTSMHLSITVLCTSLPIVFHLLFVPSLYYSYLSTMASKAITFSGTLNNEEVVEWLRVRLSEKQITLTEQQIQTLKGMQL